MDLEKIKVKMSEINIPQLYKIAKQAENNFNENRTIENELAMLETEKNFNVALERYYGYEKLLNGEDTSDVKDKIEKLEMEFIYRKMLNPRTEIEVEVLEWN